MFKSILQSHFIRYPEMQIQDVYKLIHQATMGNGHAVTSPEAARAWLERELEEMGDGFTEPTIDPISADGQMIRVHLRPFLAQGGNSQKLLNAFIRTANEFQGDKQMLGNYWDVATRVGLFPRAAMDDFIQPMQVRSNPAAHHSAIYTQLYRPAYRVILQKYL